MISRPLFWIRACLLLVSAQLLALALGCALLLREIGLLHRAAQKFAFVPAETREWVQALYAGLLDTHARYPFLLYGADWLAFAFGAAALAFLASLRDPIRHLPVINAGILAGTLAVPCGLWFGRLRELPAWVVAASIVFLLPGLGALLLARRCARIISR